MTCVDKGIGPAIGIPKRIQHLLFDCSPLSALIITHHHHHLSDRFRAVVGKYDDDVSAGSVSSSEAGDALILVEKCCHIGAKNDRHTWTKWKWHLIPLCAVCWQPRWPQHIAVRSLCFLFIDLSLTSGPQCLIRVQLSLWCSLCLQPSFPCPVVPVPSRLFHLPPCRRAVICLSLPAYFPVL